jgi:hypothetical protein
VGAAAERRLSQPAVSVTVNVQAPAHIDYAPACDACGRVQAEYLARPYSLRCRKCKHQVRRE